jgi:hypothetical protein
MRRRTGGGLSPGLRRGGAGLPATGLERRNGGSALHANGTERPLGAGTKNVQVFMHQRMAQQPLA